MHLLYGIHVCHDELVVVEIRGVNGSDVADREVVVVDSITQTRRS